MHQRLGYPSFYNMLDVGCELQDGEVVLLLTGP